METPTANSVTMKACVLRAGCGELLVRDLSTGQEVQGGHRIKCRR